MACYLPLSSSILNIKSVGFVEFESCIEDLVQNDEVRSMKNFTQHGDVSCLEHSYCVSYLSFLLCKRLGFDSRSAARGGLLHDFFLYDWHTEKAPKGLHGFSHPSTALKNANEHFFLSVIEQDCIAKHMWPLTLIPPRFKESLVVCFVDKYYSILEIVPFLSGMKYPPFSS